jgi:hypothetical protein
MNKAAYVRTASDHKGDHHCHWPGCPIRVKPAVWGCMKHWKMLPLFLRNKIWATFRPGQEITKTPSPEYVRTAREVQDWIAAYEAQQRNGRLL